MDFLLVVLTLVAGCLMPIQPAMNAVTAQFVRSPYLASLFSFVTGSIGLFLLCLAMRQHFPPIRTLAELPWWCWTAGLIGALFVTVTILAIPRLGAMSVLSILIAGQMCMSLVMDHFGWFGMPVQPISIWRIVGGILLLTGVVLIRRF